MSKNNKLFSEFAPKTKAEWLAKVAKDLKGKPLDSLHWEYENEKLSPFYHREDRPERQNPLTNRQANGAWEIGENIIVTDPKTGNEQALSALMRGANALRFELTNSLSSVEMQTLLKDIQHEWISTHFVAEKGQLTQVAYNFSAALKEKKQNPAKVACSIQTDENPLTDFENFRKIRTELPLCKLLLADITTQTGADSETLAAAVKQANSFLDTLYDNGAELTEHYQNIGFALTVSDAYFPSIAKIRALKILWQQVLTAWHPDFTADPSIEVHLTAAQQSEDEDYNKIKAATQAMSALIGGATRLYIHPSDDFKTPGGDSFSRRIALNVQHLLQQESYFDRVADPAAGSYFVEELTDLVGEKAWEIFRKGK